MKYWKMVDAEHAGAVARGSFRLGVLQDYAALEAGGGAGGPASQPFWALCLSEVGCDHDPRPGPPKAIFEISDVEVLMRYLTGAHARPIAGARGGPVLYAAQPTAVDDDQAPFRKDPRFAGEREFRLVFQPRPGVAVEGPIVTRPDYAIAALLTRVS